MFSATHSAVRAVSPLCSVRALTLGIRSSSKSSSRMRFSLSVKKRSRSAGTMVSADAVSVVIGVAENYCWRAPVAFRSQLDTEIRQVQASHLLTELVTCDLVMLRPHLTEDRGLSQR